MTETPTETPTVRAAVTARALAAVRERAPGNAAVDELETLPEDDLHRVDFLVPASDAGPELLTVLPHLTELQVVQLLSAGTDWIEGHLPPQVTLCSARGARNGPVTEWVLAALLATSSRLLECARIHTWTDRHLDDLGAWTVIVVGMGSIGRTLQARLEALGTAVVGVASRARDDLHGVDELPALLPQADAVVVLAPLSEHTRGLIGAAALAAMRDGALLVNAGRGPVVDTDALLAELQSGRLRAVLDVTDPEPLPDGHPLWSAPGLLAITPHLGGNSPLGFARAAALAGEQLVRLAAGEPLQNVVR